MIDGNPIGNYVNVTLYTSLGTNDQQPIPNFNDTVTDYDTNYELDTAGDWAMQTTVGTADQGLQITLEFPYGLAHVNSDGSMGNALGHSSGPVPARRGEAGRLGRSQMAGQPLPAQIPHNGRCIAWII